MNKNKFKIYIVFSIIFSLLSIISTGYSEETPSETDNQKSINEIELRNPFSPPVKKEEVVKPKKEEVVKKKEEKKYIRKEVIKKKVEKPKVIKENKKEEKIVLIDSTFIRQQEEERKRKVQLALEENLFSKLILTGIVIHTGNKSAIINRRIVKIGDKIDFFTIERIGKNKVSLKSGLKDYVLYMKKREQ